MKLNKKVLKNPRYWLLLPVFILMLVPAGVIKLIGLGAQKFADAVSWLDSKLNHGMAIPMSKWCKRGEK